MSSLRTLAPALALAVVAVAALAPAPPGGAEAPGRAPVRELGGLGTQAPGEQGPELALELADVAVSSQAHDAAVARRDRLVDERETAQQVIEQKGVEILDLAARDADLTTEIDEARAQAVHWEAEGEEITTTVRQIAVDSYMSGQSNGLNPMLAFDAEAQRRAATQDVTIGSLSERRTAELREAWRNASHHRDVEQVSTALRVGVREALAAAQDVREQALAEAGRLDGALLGAEADVVAERRMARVEGADFPLVVLDAYWKAARLTAFTDPGCGISWWALAGIGKVESRHGTYSGGEVRADGSLTRPVIGIPLTGSGGTAAIGDSDGGALDGDPTIDRAAGPMQFIPQTWSRWGRDGDGNGRVEIQNVYDAAASAAAYLCAGGPMSDDAGLRRGYFSYNRSLAYVDSVLAQAHHYAAAVAIPPVPSG